MDKRLIGVGLIGGILVIASIFGSWASVSGTIGGQTFSLSVSAWDMITGAETGVTGLIITSETYCFLALAGGILVIVGALGALAFPKMKILIKTTKKSEAISLPHPSIALLAIGGILIISSVSWGYGDISSELEIYGALGMGGSVGSSLYLCLVGGILALVSSMMTTVTKTIVKRQPSRSGS